MVLLSTWTIHQLVAEAACRLTSAGAENGKFEAEYLMQAVLGLSRSELFLRSCDAIPEYKVSCFQKMLARRLQNEPLQYIVGRTEFWSRPFTVTAAVLIPRQETEFVLEQVIALLQQQPSACTTLLDMGTGSGIIADVLADELSCHVVAVDCSFAALDIAKMNINRHQLQERVTFLCSDLFTGLRPREQFDCIVSNPPYVAEKEQNDLAREVREYEPSLALFAGDDGLDCYHRLVPESLGYLKKKGWLCLEIGATQGKAVQELLYNCGFRQVKLFLDYAGHSRLVVGQKI